jgi:hypothetical protein
LWWAFDQQGFIGAIIVALSYRTGRGLAQYIAALVPTFRKPVDNDRFIGKTPTLLAKQIALKNRQKKRINS